ncbi:hypothetical protein CYMTET_6428 [Cymbomonas tetramitiformis]|uniref:Uncharacterized protein n=1 Tax=Cymbomonas tetramitiformis TaxID=36881 RepID=A0AAE0LHX4_9CHLO|nr:hypothetical protein CYMTET_6428 [Cymbomonas tetramitiformis]
MRTSYTRRNLLSSPIAPGTQAPVKLKSSRVPLHTHSSSLPRWDTALCRTLHPRLFSGGYRSELQTPEHAFSGQLVLGKASIRKWGVKSVYRQPLLLNTRAAASAVESFEADESRDKNVEVTPLAMRVLFGLAYVAHIASNVAAGIGALGPTVAAVSAAHPTPITPASWAFSIWGIVFLLQGMGVLTWILNPRGGEEGATVDAVAFTAAPLWALGWAFQTAWLLYFTSQKLGPCVLCLLGAAGSLLLATAQLRAFTSSTRTVRLASLRMWGFIVPSAVNAAWLTVAVALGLLQWGAGSPGTVPAWASTALLALLLVGNWLIEAPAAALPWATKAEPTHREPHPNLAYSLTLVWALQAVRVAHMENVLVCCSPNYVERPMSHFSVTAARG